MLKLKKLVVSVAKLVKALGCGPGDRGFESHRSPHTLYYAPVAQWIEHLASDQGVGGSNPLRGTFFTL